MQRQSQFYAIQLSKRGWGCSVSCSSVIVVVCSELNLLRLQYLKSLATRYKKLYTVWFMACLMTLWFVFRFRRTKLAMLSLNLRRVLHATKRNMPGWSVRPRLSRPTLPQLKLRWDWSSFKFFTHGVKLCYSRKVQAGKWMKQNLETPERKNLLTWIKHFQGLLGVNL